MPQDPSLQSPQEGANGPPRAASVFSVDNLASILTAIQSQGNPAGMAEAHLQYEKIARGIRPNLKADGSNFAEWSEAIQLKALSLFRIPNYFTSDQPDELEERARFTGTIVEYSIDQSLSPFVASLSGRDGYRLLCDRFGLVSWSYIMSKWLKVMNSPDIINNPNRSYNKMKLAIQELEAHLGGFTVDSVLSPYTNNTEHRPYSSRSSMIRKY